MPSRQEPPQEHILSQNVLCSLGQVAINFGEQQFIFAKERVFIRWHLKKLCHEDFDVLDIKLPQIKTKRKLSNEFSKRQLTIIRPLANFPQHKAINLTKLAHSFPKLQSVFHSGHLQPKTQFLTPTALVEQF